MYWRYGRPSALPELIRQLLSLFRQLLVIFDGDVEQALDALDDVGKRYSLWREDFGPDLELAEVKQTLGPTAIVTLSLEAARNQVETLRLHEELQ